MILCLIKPYINFSYTILSNSFNSCILSLTNSFASFFNLIVTLLYRIAHLLPSFVRLAILFVKLLHRFNSVSVSLYTPNSNTAVAVFLLKGVVAKDIKHLQTGHAKCRTLFLW